MQKIIIPLLLVLGTTALAGPVEEVRCREIGFSQSVEQGDLERFSNFIDADARFVGDSVLRGVEAVTAAWAVFFAENGPRIKWRPEFVEVLEDETLALTRGPFRMTVMDDAGNKTESWGTFNSVWRLHADGQWRVVFDAGSAAGEPPSADEQALLERVDGCPP